MRGTVLRIVFLLFDDPLEAYNIYVTLEKRNFSKSYNNYLQDIILIGRVQNIPNWDLKVLASLMLSLEHTYKDCQIEFSHSGFEDTEQSINSYLSPLVHRDNITFMDPDAAQDVARWVLKLSLIHI